MECDLGRKLQVTQLLAGGPGATGCFLGCVCVHEDSPLQTEPQRCGDIRMRNKVDTGLENPKGVGKMGGADERQDPFAHFVQYSLSPSLKGGGAPW